MQREIKFQVDDTVQTVTVAGDEEGYRIAVGSSTFLVQVRPGSNGRLDLAVDGRRLRAHAVQAGGNWLVALDGATWTLSAPDPRRQAEHGAGAPGGGSLEAAMPGRVLDVLVAEGERVAAGDTLVLLEAMKMELRITAPAAGTVTRVCVTPGQVVARGERLVEVS